jgi:transposase
MLRKRLVGSVHYVLGPFGPDTDYDDMGSGYANARGKNAKKRAAVARAKP